jgi:hypothetical protein
MTTDHSRLHAEFNACGQEIIEEVLRLLLTCETPDERGAAMSVFLSIREELRYHGAPAHG